MFEVGEVIESTVDMDGLTLGKKYTVTGLNRDNDPIVIDDNGQRHLYYSRRFRKIVNNNSTSNKETNMKDAVKEYLKENKSILMTIAVALIVDHLVFGGAFREKVKGLVDGMLNKAQKKLDE